MKRVIPKVHAALAILLLAVPAAVAQGRASPLTPSDSADEARSAWADAVRAFRESDLAGARRSVDAAARLWPAQPAYLWTRAVLAARTGDTVIMRKALDDYAARGLGGDLTSDAFAPYADRAWFLALARTHERNRAPLPRSTVRLTMTDSTLFPESVAHDARTGELFVSSVRHRTVVRIDSAGVERDLWPRGQRGFGAVLGMRVSPDGARLWATMAGIPQMAGYEPTDSILAALLEISLPDGAIVRRWDIGDGVPHVLGDVAVGPAGDVLVSDSRQPVMYRLRPDGDTLETIRHPLFRSLQGIAPTPDSNVVYVADYSHGVLRVHLDSATAARVRDAEDVVSIGLDGIVWRDGAIVGIQNGVTPPRVVRFTLDSAGRAIVSAETIDRNLPLSDEPTVGTVVRDTLVYVANSPWAKYDERGNRVAGTTLARPLLLALPLPR